MKLSLLVLPGTFAVCRLEPDAKVPEWASMNGDVLSSITRTEDELSIVCPDDRIPSDVKAEKGWSVLKVEGPLDLSLTGIIASLTVPLAEAGINIFALATYDTDYLLVKKENLDRAVEVLGAFCDVRI